MCWQAPCSCNELSISATSQLLPRLLAAGLLRILCCLPMSMVFGRTVVPFLLLSLVARREDSNRASWPSFLRLPAIDVTVHGRPIVLSDAECSVDRWLRPLSIRSKQRFCRKTTLVHCVGSPSCLLAGAFFPCNAGVTEECYLVDPASSHMLVSKIKPCMCKYELIQTVKLRMAH